MSGKGITVTLMGAECAHLLDLLTANAREGGYFGNREQYWARHDRILLKLSDALYPVSEPKP